MSASARAALTAALPPHQRAVSRRKLPPGAASLRVPSPGSPSPPATPSTTMPARILRTVPPHAPVRFHRSLSCCLTRIAVSFPTIGRVLVLSNSPRPISPFHAAKSSGALPLQLPQLLLPQPTLPILPGPQCCSMLPLPASSPLPRAHCFESPQTSP
jgi:hypothetical protein